MKNPMSHGGVSRVLGSCLLATFLLTMCPGLGWVQAFAAPRDDLATARDHLAFGEYGQALALADAQIKSDKLEGDLLRDFLELRARCHIAMGQEPLARDDFCRINAMDKNWRPDPVTYTSNEVQVYDAAIAGCAVVEAEPTVVKEEGGTPFFAKPVVWVVAGAGLAAALLLGGGGGDDPGPVADGPLGDFPPPPAK